MIKHLLKLSLAALFVGHASAVLANTTLIKAERMLDVATGEIKAAPQVLIRDGKNSQISFQGAPLNADKTLDLGDVTLLPGLMDMHVHLTSDAQVHGYKRLQRTAPRVAITGVRNAKRTLENGFTTVRNLGAPGYADIALRDAIKEGDVIGPRIFAAGPSLGITGGHCDNNLLTHEHDVTAKGVADGPWEIRRKVRENIKYGADVIKFCATGGVLSKGTKVGAQQYTQMEMDALVDEAHLRGLVVAAHAHGVEGIKAAIRAKVDSVEHVSFLDDEAIALALKHGTVFSMDIYTTEYILEEGEKAGILEESLAKERVVGQTQRDNFTKAVRAGVKMVFGSDAGVYPHGDNPKQFSRMVRFGMTELAAIQAATVNSATLLKQTDLGQIKVGYHADIIAVKGNPLSDISTLENVAFVMKGGQVIKQ